MSSPNAASPGSVAVIGAGHAGLSAARDLVIAGRTVTVFERSGHPGGLAMTLPIGDTEIEKYYHHWFTSDDDMIGLVRELGLEDRLEWRSPVMGMFCEGGLYRFVSPGDLLRFRPFSFPAKVRFALATLFLQHYPRRETFEGVTAAEWLRRWAGKSVYDKMWGPLLRAKFGRHAEEISMAWIWNKMRLRGRSRTSGGTRESLGYMRGGFGVVTRAIVREIEARGGEVRLARRVRRIDPNPGGGFVVETSTGPERFDEVLSTVAPPILAELAPSLPGDFRGRLAAVDHSAIICTLLCLDRSFSPIYWMNVSDDRIPFGGLIEHTNFIPRERYGGDHLLYVSHYTYPDAPEWRFGTEELLAHYEPGLRRIRKDFDRSWIRHAMPFRDRYAQPIVRVGYEKTLLPVKSPLPGLWLATMAHVYPEDRGTNYAVRVGRETARQMIAASRPRAHQV